MRVVLVLLGTAALAGCAGAAAPIVEAGYPVGSLGVAAIQRGDWETAERLLTEDRRVPADDPARLINLGRVYLETGRRAEAVAMWRRALAASDHGEVELLSGGMARTDEIARTALARFDRPVETAAR